MHADTSSILSPGDDPGAFLETYVAPLRVSGVLQSGYPLICSLWYEYADGAIWCATQRTAKIATVLAANPLCAFELGPNMPPYFGVRGRGDASLQSEDAGELLQRLIHRYLGGQESRLASMLLSRVADEVAIRIVPRKIFSWDYRDRMKG